jgi:phosphatidate cytidylyltransferase
VLLVDSRLAPWYPFLFLLLLCLSQVACFELLWILPDKERPQAWLCSLGVAALILVNWTGVNVWPYLALVFAVIVVAAFIAEMAVFRQPGGAVPRIALTIWIVAYLGLLPVFLARLRWLPGLNGTDDATRSTVALAMAIFVPKCCDTGAYFTGRLLGRHRMTPVLSPKKTWEGLAGGLALAMIAAFGINRIGGGLTDLSAVGFGLIVGGAGVLGDLAESLIKRDCEKKDASTVMPGFGGVLDVVDAILFAAPVAYWWFTMFEAS